MFQGKIYDFNTGAILTTQIIGVSVRETGNYFNFSYLFLSFYNEPYKKKKKYIIPAYTCIMLTHTHAEFLTWNNPSYIFGTVNYHFENMKYVQASLALYWWQRLLTFGIGRIRVKMCILQIKVIHLQCFYKYN